MKQVLFPMMAAAMLLSACAGEIPASRSVSDLTLAASNGEVLVQGPVQKVLMGQYVIKDVRITVPQTLRVSEANVYYPIADIVWRGEPIGNRHKQVSAIFAEAAAAASSHLTNGPEVIVELEVTRFHCVTEKTRYTVGGTHSLHFNLTVRDASSGQVLDGPRAIVADVKAAGGAQAVAEEQMGRTQRVVVVESLAGALRRALSVEVGSEMIMSRGLSDPQNLVVPF